MLPFLILFASVPKVMDEFLIITMFKPCWGREDLYAPCFNPIRPYAWLYGEILNHPVLTLFILWECMPKVKGEDLNHPALTLFVLWECVPEVEGECLNRPF